MRSKVAKRILEETPEETKIFARLYADIIVRINQLLKENQLNQKNLADKLEKRPSEINKWLTNEHNFTIRSLAKLHAELGEAIINVPQRKSFSDEGKKGYVTVYRNNSINTQGIEYTSVWKKKSKNKTTLNVS